MTDMQLIFFEVSEPMMLPHPDKIHLHELKYKRTEGFFFKLEEGQPANILSCLSDPPYWLDESIYKSVRLPSAFMALVANGVWTWIGVPVSKAAPQENGIRCRRSGYPLHLHHVGLSEVTCAYAKEDEDELEAMCLHDPFLFEPRSLIEFLVLIKPHVKTPLQDQSEEARRLRAFVSRLQTHVYELEVCQKSNNYVYGKHTFVRFQSLIDCVLLHQMVRGGQEHVLKSLCLAFKVLLPPTVAAELIDQVRERKIHTPQNAQVSNLRGALDAGFMGVMCEYFFECTDGDGISIYPMLDFSPQGGRNNELNVSTLVPKQSLHRLFSLKLQMCERRCLSFVFGCLSIRMNSAMKRFLYN